MLDWDDWRLRYRQITHADQIDFYRLVAAQFPNQKCYNLNFVQDHIPRGCSISVAEVGGWNGALAADVLARNKDIASWVNYEFAPQMVANPVCEDPRYRATTGDDFAWICAESADVLILSHSMEHMLEEEFSLLVMKVNPQLLILDAPLTEVALPNYSGSAGTHIYNGTWQSATEVLVEYGYSPILADGNRRVFQRMPSDSGG